MNWCILIPIIVGIISAILGYLIGRMFKESDVDNSATYTKRITKLEADLAACKANKANLARKSSLKSTTSASVAPVAAVSTASALAATAASKVEKKIETKVAPVVANVSTFDAGAAKAVFGKKIKQDDLKVVEGIGPKISELFHNHDIKTWRALSETSVEKCKEVLLSGGDRFKMHTPRTWPAQAKLAHEGKWAELLKWQDELDGGK